MFIDWSSNIYPIKMKFRSAKKLFQRFIPSPSIYLSFCIFILQLFPFPMLISSSFFSFKAKTNNVVLPEFTRTLIARIEGTPSAAPPRTPQRSAPNADTRANARADPRANAQNAGARADSRASGADGSHTAEIVKAMNEGNLERAQEVLHEAHAKDAHVYARAYTAIVKGLLARDDLAGVGTVLNDMSQKRVNTPLGIYTLLINFALEKENTELRDSVLAQMRQRGVNPDYQLYLALANTAARNGEESRLAELLRDVPAELREMLYQDALTAFARSGNAQGAYAVLDAMEAHKGPAPNVVSCNTLIRELIRTGKRDEAMRTFARMKPWRVHNSATFDFLMNPTSVEDCEEMLREMRACGIEPSTRVYNKYMQARRQAGDFAGCEELFREMKAQGPPPDTVTFNTLMACRRDNAQGCRELLEECIARGLRPDALTASTALRSAQDDPAVCAGLRNVLRAIGVVPDDSGFAVLAGHAAAREDWVACDALLEEMKQVRGK